MALAHTSMQREPKFCSLPPQTPATTARGSHARQDAERPAGSRDRRGVRLQSLSVHRSRRALAVRCGRGPPLGTKALDRHHMHEGLHGRCQPEGGKEAGRIADTGLTTTVDSWYPGGRGCGFRAAAVDAVAAEHATAVTAAHASDFRTFMSNICVEPFDLGCQMSGFPWSRAPVNNLPTLAIARLRRSRVSVARLGVRRIGRRGPVFCCVRS